MVMVFILVSTTQEKLSELVDKAKNKKEEEKLRKEREQEEAEQIKFHGTHVTKEIFLAWRMAFEEEMAPKKKEKKELKEKLTGTDVINGYLVDNRDSNPFTPKSDQLQFSLSVSHQRYIIQYGELGI